MPCTPVHTPVVWLGRGRHVSSLAVAILCAGLSGPASAADKSFNVPSGNWFAPGNWAPFGIPLPGDHVSLGNLVIAHDGDVDLTVATQISSLDITNRAALYVALGGSLVVSGPTTLSGGDASPLGSHSFMAVVDGPAVWDAEFDVLDVSDHAVTTFAGAAVYVNDQVTFGNGTRLNVGGSGSLWLGGNGPLGLRNDGTLQVLSGFTILFDEARVDLDGITPGDSVIDLSDGSFGVPATSRLTLGGPGLFDAMDGLLLFAPGAELEMALDEGWELGAGGHIAVVNVGVDDAPPALITGEALSVSGEISFSGDPASLFIEVPTTFGSSLPGSASPIVTVGPASTLVINNSSTVVSGTFTAEPDSLLDFFGPLDLEGGVFHGEVGPPDPGFVRFAGGVSLDGEVWLHGLIDFASDVSVVGPSQLHVGSFNLDGFSGASEWFFSNALTVSVDPEVGFVPNGTFDGAFHLTGTALGKLTVNVEAPATEWRLGGLLDVGGLGAIMMTRLEGSPVRVIDGGTIGVSSHARINAPVTTEFGSTIDFATINAKLRLAEDSLIRKGTIFVGGGTLENESGATLSVGAGLSLLTSHLWNAGTLAIAEGPGPVGVNALNLQPSSTYRVNIGSSDTDDMDTINAGSPCTIGGTLEVRLIDLGGGAYEPPLGKSFTVLKVPGSNSVSGAFASVPPSFVPGKVYTWSTSITSTQSTSVTVKVAGITPCPGELTGDGVIDAADLAVLLGAWGPCLACDADLTTDSFVDAADLAILLGAWGACEYSPLR
jgi:hypothetical protein